MEQNEVTLDGIHLFEGFLLGGEVIYQAKDEEEEKNQDMDLKIPWYVRGRAQKVIWSEYSQMFGRTAEDSLPLYGETDWKMPVCFALMEII